MHCQNCGVESVEGQSYCKRCGASLSVTTTEVAAPRNPLPKVGGMFWAIAIFGLGSIATLLGSLVALAAIGMNGEGIRLTGIVVGAVIFGIAGMLIWQLSRLINLAQNATIVQSKKLKTAEQPAYPQIAATPRAVPSVTEHTTRNFEPAPHHEGRSSRE